MPRKTSSKQAPSQTTSEEQSTNAAAKTAETAPKKRGRKPGSGAGKSAEGAKKRGRKPGVNNSTSKAKKSLKTTAKSTSASGPYAKVGATLAKAREKKNLSIHQVAEEIKIRDTYIRALERGDLKKLPGGLYVKAYIRNYAAFLGLDANALVRSIDTAPPPPIATKEPKELKISVERPRDRTRPQPMVIFTSIFVVFTVFVIWATYKDNSNQQSIPSDDSVIEEIETPVETNSETVALPDGVVDEELETPAETVEKQVEELDEETATAPAEEQKPVVDEEVEKAVEEQMREKVETLPKPAEPIQSSEEAAVEVAYADKEITVVATSALLLTLRDEGGNIVQQKTLAAGDVLFLPQRTQKEGWLVMDTTFPEFVEIYVDGERIPSLKSLESSAQGIVLDVPKIIGTIEPQR